MRRRFMSANLINLRVNFILQNVLLLQHNLSRQNKQTPAQTEIVKCFI